MFLIRRPTSADVQRFLHESQHLPLSYGPVHLLDGPTPGYTIDESIVAVGHGVRDFERACAALRAWKHFDLGWVRLYPPAPPLEPGTVVALVIQHLGFWSLNGCRVVYQFADSAVRFGFGYGTLTNHAASGEELFEVFVDPVSASVMYRIRAASRTQTMLARAGYPIARRLQARFRRDSASALRRAIANEVTPRP